MLQVTEARHSAGRLVVDTTPALIENVLPYFHLLYPPFSPPSLKLVVVTQIRGNVSIVALLPASHYARLVPSFLSREDFLQPFFPHSSTRVKLRLYPRYALSAVVGSLFILEVRKLLPRTVGV